MIWNHKMGTRWNTTWNIAIVMPHILVNHDLESWGERAIKYDLESWHRPVVKHDLEFWDCNKALRPCQPRQWPQTHFPHQIFRESGYVQLRTNYVHVGCGCTYNYVQNYEHFGSGVRTITYKIRTLLLVGTYKLFKKTLELQQQWLPRGVCQGWGVNVQLRTKLRTLWLGGVRINYVQISYTLDFPGEICPCHYPATTLPPIIPITTCHYLATTCHYLPLCATCFFSKADSN